ncbi:alpha/beta hydrolase, partial [Sinorhizobium meliloti]
RDSASGAKDEFIEVLSALKTRPNIKRIHILAHSMGNQIVLDALAHHAHTTHPLGVCEILMAAPDVDSDSYRKWAPKVKAAVTGMTLYASACDKAMMLSKAIAGNIPRAGDVPSDGPVLVPEIQAIDVTELGSEMLGLNHGLYAQKRSILNDIFVLLETGKRSPQDRLADIRGVPDGASDPRYWKYAKSA